MSKHVIEIYPIDVQERMKKGEKLNIVDVREDAEIATGKIPGAKHIPLQQLDRRYKEIDPAKETILVCRSGNRSSMACEFLQGLGYKHVKNMLGGMNYWRGDIV